MPVTVATWNVNSIRAREERFLDFLDRHAPDIVLLQETKVTDDVFPVDAVREKGYHSTVHGQPTYNGVAIVSKQEPDDVLRGLPGDNDDSQARFIAATVHGLRVASAYIPNGRSVGTDKYAYKLAWLERLNRWMKAELDSGAPLLVGGDYNIAPDDGDAAFPERWVGSVLCHEDVRKAWDGFLDLGLADVIREHNDPPGPFSWWDYRRLAFPKGDGLRIDHFLAAPRVAERAIGAFVDRDERKGKSPSDHAPVMATFDD